jgi:hypothetical protein
MLVATSGIVAPVVASGRDGILTVASATLTPDVRVFTAIYGPVVGTGYAQLEAGSIALGNASLQVALFGYTPPSGQTFTIVTNATGTFAGLPEGAVFEVSGTGFRITYRGGDGNDVVLTADNPPTITGLSDQLIEIGATLSPLAFTVGDDLTPAGSLVVTAASSNAALLPSAGIAIGGSGGSRTLTATPVLGASGTTTITVTVSDGAQTTQRAFTLTVEAAPTWFLAEGATGSFFRTDLLLANPSSFTAPVVIRFFKADGTTVLQNRTLPATSRTTLRVNEVPGLEEATAFSTSVTSTGFVPLVVERTMWWDAAGYGAHGEKASDAAASQWYFAEGAQGFFHTYYLLLNPNAVTTVAHVTYLLESGAPVQRDYTMAATSRLTIDTGADDALTNQAFGAIVTFDLPGMAERAMYFGDAPQFSGGHAAAGVTAPSTSWLFAEGATGPYFDAFLLLVNPGATTATITLTYLPTDGAPIVRTHTLAGNRRLTINIAEEDPALASAAVATLITADQPIVAERAQYWPRGAWSESHDSAGETTAGTRWGFAEGRVGGANHAQTYVLIANPGTQAADITATFLRSDGTTIVKTFTVAAMSRFTIAVSGGGSHVSELADESFGIVIDATHPVVAERSLYTDATGVTWAAGTNVTGTRLP